MVLEYSLLYCRWRWSIEKQKKSYLLLVLEFMNDSPEDEKKYLAGFPNRLIRYWYYLENGLGILNEFRNLFLGIVALYIALKLTNLFLMVAMFIPCCIVLTVVGYVAVHRIAKVKEWINLRFSSHFGIRSFDYQRANYQLLKKISEKL